VKFISVKIANLMYADLFILDLLFYFLKNR